MSGIPNRTGIRLPPLGAAKMNWKEWFLHDVRKKSSDAELWAHMFVHFLLDVLYTLKRQKEK